LRPAALVQLGEEGTTLGLTAWPGYGLRSSFPRDDPSIGPQPKLQVDRTANDAANGIVWHLDCGLIVSLPGFRRRLRALKLPAYRAHLKHCHELYEYDACRGTDEMILEMFLLAGRVGSPRRVESWPVGTCLDPRKSNRGPLAHASTPAAWFCVQCGPVCPPPRGPFVHTRPSVPPLGVNPPPPHVLHRPPA
jgi:hypothetical protein